MKTSAAGRRFITTLEGIRTEAYPDPATGGDPWTIGIGHTGPEVHEGMKISKQEAGRILTKDLVTVEKAIAALVKVPLLEKEFDALASIAFNIGVQAFTDSTLLKRLNLGERAPAADHFLRWNKANGQVMAGLVKRRAAERALFIGFDHSTALKKGEEAYAVYNQRLQNP